MAMNDVRQMAGRSVTDLPAPSLTRHRKWWGLLFVAPAVLFFAVFAIFPIGFGVYLSFTRYDLLTPPQWIGLGNYTGLFRDRAFLVAIGNTMLFVFGATVPVWVLSLWLALRFDRCFASRNIWKSLFFSPVLPPLVVVAVIWKVLLHPNGLVTGLVGPIFGVTEIRWLTDPVLSRLVMIVVNDWTMIPFFSMIWLAGLAGVPDDLRRAGELDGASDKQIFFLITLPLLKPTAVLVAALSTINAFQAFVLQYEMTPDRGGPADANLTLGLLILKYGFQYFRMGEAAAASVLLFAVILLVTAAQLWLRRQK
ncbi:ABC transporter permease subunit [Sinorhizobium medicae]|nr:ABC transporter permease subunit [Sinorhizobium medicae]